MNQMDHVVYVVDDDLLVQEALTDLLASAGFNAVAFGSVGAYLQESKPEVPRCLVLDIKLPDINGLDFQRQLSATDHIPIVFITGHGDIPSTVRAIKAGALDFLTKPFSDEALLQAVRAALDQDRKALKDRTELAELKTRYTSLTPRERDVLPLIVSGLLNKQAAAELGISEFTLQIHRSNVMRKMAAGSLPELVRLAARLDLSIPPGRGGKRMYSDSSTVLASPSRNGVTE
jgi:FixJ family two-component response regulator